MAAASCCHHVVNRDRLRRLLEESAKIGLDEAAGPGLHRAALSDYDMEGRAWLTKTMEGLGLEVFQDGAMNIHGRVSPADSPGAAVVMTGSHHDTVRGGGRLDGALGVIAGVECLARIKELGVPLKYGLEVVNFTDEEGRFGGMLGSMCLAGKLTPEKVLTMASYDGQRAANLLALRSSASESTSTVSAVQEQAAAEAAVGAAYGGSGGKGEVHAYVELHIEQGPVLDAAGESVGVVSGICGLWKAQFLLKGQANHAGTTPMAMRRDAFAGCAALHQKIPAILAAHGAPDGSTVCTLGSVQVTPNVPNVVPGECLFTVELRDMSQKVIDAMAAAVQAELHSAADRLRLELARVTVMSNMPPVAAHPSVIACISDCAAAAGFPGARVMPSGAAHDAQQIATIAPMGMVFVPSINGVSHHHSEDTAFEHLEAGTNVLLNTMLRLATGDHALLPDTTTATTASNSSSSSSSGGSSSSNGVKEPPLQGDTALLCIDLQKMPPTSAREGVDFNEEDVAYFNSNLPAVLARVAQVQTFARAEALSRTTTATTTTTTTTTTHKKKKAKTNSSSSNSNSAAAGAAGAGRAVMEVVHCRITSMTRDGRDRSALHKRMKIHVPPPDCSNGSGGAGGDWMDGVGPADDELVFNKTGSNAFVTTNLHYVLGNIGVRRLVCVGVLTDECVAGTVKAAADLGYECTVLTDACLAAAPDRHDGALKTVSRFAEVTTTAEWLATASAELDS